MAIDETDFEYAWGIYCSKGPVRHETSQHQANRAWNVVQWRLTSDERRHLATARGHAMLGEGRAEFDRVCGEVSARLFSKQREAT